jgi:hypothetical protein
VMLASPRLAAESVQELRQHLQRFAAGSDEGRAFFAVTGVAALRPVPDGTMAALDGYVTATRRLLAEAP